IILIRHKLYIGVAPASMCSKACYYAEMTFFETLVALLAVAILLLQFTLRMRLPYPGILAAAGVGVAMLPGAPTGKS
ncbi:hypothetical protein ACC718_38295, partial [Rhizobium ruizarguesonis]